MRRKETAPQQMFGHSSIHKEFDEMMWGAPRPIDEILEAVNLEDAHNILKGFSEKFSILAVTPYQGEQTPVSADKLSAKYLRQTAPA